MVYRNGQMVCTVATDVDYADAVDHRTVAGRLLCCFALWRISTGDATTSSIVEAPTVVQCDRGLP